MATVPWGTEGKNKAPTSSHVLSPQDPNVLHISATYIQRYRPQALVLDGETEARLDGPVYWVRCLPAQGEGEKEREGWRLTLGWRLVQWQRT